MKKKARISLTQTRANAVENANQSCIRSVFSRQHIITQVTKLGRKFFVSMKSTGVQCFETVEEEWEKNYLLKPSIYFSWYYDFW